MDGVFAYASLCRIGNFLDITLCESLFTLTVTTLQFPMWYKPNFYCSGHHKRCIQKHLYIFSPKDRKHYGGKVNLSLFGITVLFSTIGASLVSNFRAASRYRFGFVDILSALIGRWWLSGRWWQCRDNGFRVLSAWSCSSASYSAFSCGGGVRRRVLLADPSTPSKWIILLMKVS